MGASVRTEERPRLQVRGGCEGGVGSKRGERKGWGVGDRKRRDVGYVRATPRRGGVGGGGREDRRVRGMGAGGQIGK